MYQKIQIPNLFQLQLSICLVLLYGFTSCSFMNSLTLLSMSWYLAVALVICWIMVVTWPNIVAYSKAGTWNIFHNFLKFLLKCFVSFNVYFTYLCLVNLKVSLKDLCFVLLYVLYMKFNNFIQLILLRL